MKIMNKAEQMADKKSLVEWAINFYKTRSLEYQEKWKVEKANNERLQEQIFDLKAELEYNRYLVEKLVEKL